MNFYSYSHGNKPALPCRPQISNKGTFGRVLCVCGSVCMAGAAYLSAKAAYRSGAGLVEIITCDENRVILQTLLPEAVMTIYNSSSPDADIIRDAVNRADTIVIGCGLGKSRVAHTVLTCVLKSKKCPTVIDADALNLLSENNSLMRYTAGCVITPHPAEMNRLGGFADGDYKRLSDSADESIRKEILVTAASKFAAAHSLVCVLKDHRTVVSDGTDNIYINTSGNSGMATGGSGDVLAGIIGGLTAQFHGNVDLMQCATVGVYIHGLAGDIAAEKLGEYSVMASDIIDGISDVMKKQN